ncbi:PfaB family protein [Anabaenopsis elenkinii]|uniref:Type I polyketide synthase n=1 Tax=Anabaenopsis elenkinii CCIBt3563 TaxID=2779889 RepID=A0A7U3RZ29_9CYAN|nr:type I polyketide synthase [Anabaenopsis elenkinii]QOV21812.1 type I polyketide synthase [Anabaenopsis elenkinii CCIBt3563]
MEELTRNQIPKIAIVGMDCYLGGNCHNLDSFEETIYEGEQHFVPLPAQRWQGIANQKQLLSKYGFDDRQAPLGAYIQNRQLPSVGVDEFDPQKLLMIHVADQALQDAGLDPGSRVAVLIVSATKLVLPESPVIKSPDTNNQLANYVSHKCNLTGPSLTFTAEQKSVFPALKMAQKLLANQEVDAVLVGAVELAGDSASVLLRNQITPVNTGVNTLSYDQNSHGWMVGEGAAAIVLKLHETAKRDHNRIYAAIDALAIVENTTSAINSIPTHIDAESITQACQEAFALAKIKPTDINYLEVMGSGIPSQDESEIKGLLRAYGTCEASLSCALGSAQANVGHTYAVSGLVSIVKTALCLYRRYIPVVPQWSSPKLPQMWQDSPFYVATESKPWLLEAEATKRIAAVNGMEVDGSYAHLILSEEVGQQEHDRYLGQIPYYLFAIAADDQASLLDQISTLQNIISNCSSLATAARETFRTFQKHHHPTYTLSILGRNQDELMREIERSFQGVKIAFETGKDWQTPVGSYFTAKPLGKDNKIAFVYSGSFNAYVGIARYLFRVFPQIYDDLVNRGIYNRAANVEKLLYPRSLKKLSKRELETIEQKLIDDPVALLEVEVYFTGFITAILKDYFQIKPQSAFGYSLGETSMMFAQGIWTNFKQSSQNLNSSSLFKTRLAGCKDAVREYWGLSQKHNINDENLWNNYVLLCPPSLVKEAIKSENRVYLTLINTPEEVIIGGDPQACQRVIQHLKCNAYLTPLKHVIHCEPMRSEYDEIARINTLAIQEVKETIFYSAAEYEPITLESNAVGQNIAKGLCQELDFPRLVNRVYNDGSKIFIEVGVGSNCSRWISKILQDKEHFTVSLNRRGTDDHISIIRVLAKLLSHRVDMDLSPLYSLSSPSFKKNQIVEETITLANHTTDNRFMRNNQPEILPEKYYTLPISPPSQQYELLEFSQSQPRYSMHKNSILTEEPRVMSKLIANNHQTSSVLLRDRASTDLLEQSISLPPKVSVGSSASLSHSVEVNDTVLPQEDNIFIAEEKNDKALLKNNRNPEIAVDKKQLANLRNSQYENLMNNAFNMAQNHKALLEIRQVSLHQISTIIDQQLNLYRTLFNQSSD